MTKLASIPPWLARIFPFAPKSFVTPAGARMSYLDEGPRASAAVLMLHGNPTWSFYFRDAVRALSTARRCIVPDHIGMGLSEKPATYRYTLAQRIDDVAALVSTLGLTQIDLVVHDWGCAIGFGVATRYPGLIRRLVILNTAAFASDRIPARIALCKLPLLGPCFVRGLNGFAGPATTMAMSRRKLSAEEKRAYLFPYDNWSNRVAVSAFVQDIPMRASHPSWEALRTIEAGLPQFRDRDTAIVWGGRDFCFNDHFLARWREFLPQAQVHRMADAGHYVLDDARDEVVPLVTAFLK